jgi:hypothetical protein
MSTKFVLARTFLLCQYAGLMTTGKPLTIQEFARLGGKARAEKLNKQQRKESARKAALARWKNKKKDKSS